MSYDSDVLNATSGRGEANWDQIIKLCNRIRDSVGPSSMSQAMLSVMRRVKHSDPNIQLHALTLLEACVSNCGKDFQLELTKSTFQSDIKAIVTGSYSDPRVTQRTKDLLVSWYNEFRNESSMVGLLKFVEQLRKDGIAFQGLQLSATTTTAQSSSGSAPSRSQEDDDLKRAIQLSLHDSPAAPSAASTSSSLYPTMALRSSPTPAKKKAVKKVRAIYDFVAAEDNELTFRAGEIITLLDDSDENWWKGETQLGVGLFPASFVSSNLDVDPEPSKKEAQSKSKEGGAHKSKGKGNKGKGKGTKKLVVNVQKIDLLLDMIKGADVTSEENLAENETLIELEDECKKMKPAVEETIAALQRKEDEMQAINQKFEEALAMYRKLLAEGPRLSSTTISQQPVAATSVTPLVSQPQSTMAQSYSQAQAPISLQPSQQPSSYQAPSPLANAGLSLATPSPNMSMYGTAGAAQVPYSASTQTAQPSQLHTTGARQNLSSMLLEQPGPSLPPLTNMQQSLYTQQPPPASLMAQQMPPISMVTQQPPPYHSHPTTSLYQPQNTLVAQQPLL